MELDISLAPETIFNIGLLPVTNTLFWSFVVSMCIIAVTLFVRFNLKIIPGVIQNIVGALLEQGMEFTKTIIESDHKARRVFPLVFTMFIFILAANLMAFIPGQSAITVLKKDGSVVPLFRVITSDYAFVLMMTMVSVIIIQFVAIFTHGPFGYLKKFLNFKSPMSFILGLMDIIGEIAKILSLSFRLFGNMFAGEVLSIVMLSLAPFFIPLPFAFLGLLTAVIQAFVFSLLTLIFISMASKIESDEILESASI